MQERSGQTDIQSAQNGVLARWSVPVLTHNIQIDKVAHHGLRRYLALVRSFVPLLNPFDLQGPVFRLLVVCRLKPLV